MENEEYPSDSDQSDEDFCPDKDDSDVSEEESGADEISDEENKSHKNEKTKKLNKNTKNTKPSLTERSTRATITSQENDVTEKDHLESDEEDDKERSDALWADFLSDTKSTEKITIKNEPKEKTVESRLTENSEKSGKDNKTVEKPCNENVKITEILEFAGEEIKVTKEIPIETKSIEHVKSTSSRELPKFNKGPMKRPGGGGLGSVLGQIGKKTKISVLEKSKLDWDGFKKDEGLAEELQTFNKGKDGYLERQDFLQRTDVRQFEIERNLRQNKRNN